MALREGEVYRCPDANCGCEITVTKGARRLSRSGTAALLLRQDDGKSVGINNGGNDILISIIVSAIKNQKLTSTKR